MKTVVVVTITTEDGEVLDRGKVWLIEKEQSFEDGPTTVAMKIWDRIGRHFEIEEHV